MSKRSGAIILTTTATITVCVAAVAVSLGLGRGRDSYSNQILEEAKKRQSYTIAQVPQPLETDLEVLTEEDRMAEKVSAILKEDKDFLTDIGDQSAVYVGEKISDLEQIYSADMISRIDEKSSGALAEAKTYATDLTSSVEFKAKAYTDNAVTSSEDLMKYLLSNTDFLNAISAAVLARTGKHLEMDDIVDAITGSEDVKSLILSSIEAYHEEHPMQVVDAKEEKKTSAIPLPTFNVDSSENYSEEEYIQTRNAARYTEIDKILDFLGY